MSLLLALALLSCDGSKPGADDSSLEGDDSSPVGDDSSPVAGDDTASGEFSLCAWLVEHTPAEVSEDEAIEVYCQEQDAPECSSDQRLVTTRAIIDEGAAACRGSGNERIFEELPSLCQDENDEGIRYPAVRCWRIKE